MSEAKNTLTAARAWMDRAETLINSAPAADDLDGMSAFAFDLGSVYARWAQLAGECETVYARLVQHELSTMEEEDLKKIKHSSTLTEKWVQGRYPDAYSVVARMQSWGRVLSEVMQNTRTVMASWRQEREFELRATIRNQQ